MVDALQAQFEKPTAIQSQAWPVLLQGRDFIGVAKTGSGKTLAFTLPAIVHARAQQTRERRAGPTILVMAPTRELAVQIQGEAEKFAGRAGLKTLTVYGGASREGQRVQLSRGVDMLIATPGRLLDFLQCGDVSLGKVTYLVLDEADRMLDMGFEKEIVRILGYVPDRSRQTLMFSATWPREVQSLARQYCLQDPVKVQVGSQETLMAGGLTMNKDIQQEVIVTDPGKNEKFDLLCSMLEELAPTETKKVLVFV